MRRGPIAFHAKIEAMAVLIRDAEVYAISRNSNWSNRSCQSEMLSAMRPLNSGGFTICSFIYTALDSPLLPREVWGERSPTSRKRAVV